MLEKLRAEAGFFAAIALATELAAGSATAEEIVATHYGALLTSAPIAVALERDEFTKRGVDITSVISTTGGATALRNMFAGKIPYAEVATAAALAAIKEGYDVKIVNAAARSIDDLVWVTLPNSSIKSIKDLAGKKVGITNPKSMSETTANMVFEAAGFKSGEYQLIATGSVAGGLTALEQGGVDATLMNEPLYTARRDRYRIAFDAHGLPPMTQTVGVSTSEFAKQSPDKLRAIIAARRAAVDFIYEQPEAAARMIAKRYGDTLPVSVAIPAVKRMVEMNYWSRGNFEMAGLEAMTKALERQGELAGPVDWPKVIDRSYLPADLRN
jgi:NitT/TauT family transport system substrate-binding protein